MLNDFVFCPYSIYLHNVYMDADEGLYHSVYQVRGKIAHQTVDEKRASSKINDLLSLPVSSDKYKLFGKGKMCNLNKYMYLNKKMCKCF